MGRFNNRYNSIEWFRLVRTGCWRRCSLVAVPSRNGKQTRHRGVLRRRAGATFSSATPATAMKPSCRAEWLPASFSSPGRPKSSKLQPGPSEAGVPSTPISLPTRSFAPYRPPGHKLKETLMFVKHICEHIRVHGSQKIVIEMEEGMGCWPSLIIYMNWFTCLITASTFNFVHDLPNTPRFRSMSLRAL